MLRLSLFVCLLPMALAAPAAAQSTPGNNVVAPVPPPPPPREGTVGPEQLRDFSLPGTRQTPPAAEQPSSPVPAQPTTRPRPASPPEPRSAGSAPASERPRADVRQRSAETSPSPSIAQPQGEAAAAPAPPLTDFTISPAPVADPSATAPAAPTLTPEAPSAPMRWWPWLLVALTGGIAFAVWGQRRRRSREAAADELAYAAPPVPSPALNRAPAPSAPPVSAPPSQPPLPSGLVTTRLNRVPASGAAPVPHPPPMVPTGAVVSTRLRPWVELDLQLREVLIRESEILLRFSLMLQNAGSANARDIIIEALALNASESQAGELGAFYARPAGAEVAIVAMVPMGSGNIDHEVRMPRAAVREYEAGGRRLFVPILAFNAAYRWSNGEGRTGAAFLIGHGREDADRLAPLRLDSGAGKLTGLAVRRLDQGDRR